MTDSPIEDINYMTKICNDILYLWDKVVSLIPTRGVVYSMQRYMIKFVSDLQEVSGFIWVLRFSAPIKLTATI